MNVEKWEELFEKYGTQAFGKQTKPCGHFEVFI